MRRFTHHNKFKDGTDYLEYDGKDTYIVLRDGTRKKCNGYSIETMERRVQEGVWVEMAEDALDIISDKVYDTLRGTST